MAMRTAVRPSAAMVGAKKRQRDGAALLRRQHRVPSAVAMAEARPPGGVPKAAEAIKAPMAQQRAKAARPRRDARKRTAGARAVAGSDGSAVTPAPGSARRAAEAVTLTNGSRQERAGG